MRDEHCPRCGTVITREPSLPDAETIIFPEGSSNASSVTTEITVDDDFMRELLGDAVKPLALDGVPVVLRVDFLHRIGDALLERQ